MLILQLILIQIVVQNPQTEFYQVVHFNLATDLGEMANWQVLLMLNVRLHDRIDPLIINL